MHVCVPVCVCVRERESVLKGADPSVWRWVERGGGAETKLFGDGVKSVTSLHFILSADQDFCVGWGIEGVEIDI